MFTSSYYFLSDIWKIKNNLFITTVGWTAINLEKCCMVVAANPFLWVVALLHEADLTSGEIDISHRLGSDINTVHVVSLAHFTSVGQLMWKLLYHFGFSFPPMWNVNCNFDGPTDWRGKYKQSSQTNSRRISNRTRSFVTEIEWEMVRVT
jgi:hypothetical protein